MYCNSFERRGVRSFVMNTCENSCVFLRFDFANKILFRFLLEMNRTKIGLGFEMLLVVFCPVGELFEFHKVVD